MARPRTKILSPETRRAATPRKSLTDQVYESLREEILKVQWAPGDIVAEPELAARYGVSKTPVREALRLLVQDGWVLVLPRKGYLIRPLGLEDVSEVFALRQMLEPQLAAEAARKSPEPQLADLRDLVAEQRHATHELESALLAARLFHLKIAELSGNGRAVRFLAGLLDEVRRLHYLMPQLENHITSQAEVDAHDLIVEALSARDADGAAEHMHEHLLEAGREMVGVFGGLPRQDYRRDGATPSSPA
jgi:DNA-binding GntR family transcriptional regulator